MKKVQVLFVFTVMMLLASSQAFAFGPGFDPDVEPYAAPLDGGTSLLAIAGIVYGVRMYMKNKPAKAKA